MRRLTVLCVALCALAGAVVARAAGTGTVSGSASGLPAGAVGEGVQAINAKGVIGGAGPLSATGAYSLKLKPGAWIIETSSESPNGPLTSLGAPVRVRAHGTTRAKPTPVKAEASGAGKLKRGSVVTVSTIELTDERDVFGTGLTGNLYVTSTVTNDLFRACASRGITFVDTTDTFVKFAQQESRLSSAGRLSVPFKFHPVSPQFAVDPDSGNEEGSAAGAVTPNDMTVRLALDRAGTMDGFIKGPNLSQTFSSSPDDADVISVVHKEDAGLAAKVCGA
ncbi:MAG TPA: hypothetical protein VMF14_22780 [Solirubrobacteraceae bacterium]|nr:hypothetical protein [Solirubrobacteraceae bacterium]